MDRMALHCFSVWNLVFEIAIHLVRWNGHQYNVSDWNQEVILDNDIQCFEVAEIDVGYSHLLKIGRNVIDFISFGIIVAHVYLH